MAHTHTRMHEGNLRRKNHSKEIVAQKQDSNDSGDFISGVHRPSQGQGG